MVLDIKHQVGDAHKEFIFTKALPIEELQMVLYELEHQPTRARVVHLDADDPENLFCLSLQTLPSDSTGVAHILEHTVLCGSKKFPVKDPFFSMTRRSLNTFMNAMTGADFTCYPASSQVEKDFYHLLEVYLDAVFFPELKEMSFLQEGHRFEFDPHLMYKGVVYNEMKGSLSNPEARLWHEISQYLTPDLTYAFNSGGDPKDIPDLTYEELKKFHATYYHPSRCIFFFYGNIPLQKHLDFIHKHVLKDSNKLPPLPKLPKQKRWTAPVTKEGYYPATEGKGFVTFAWLTTPIDNQEDALALAALDSILMETDASPLKFALLQSGLCTQADGYFDTEMSEFPYAIVCRGSDKNAAKDLKTLLFVALEKLVSQGIAEEKVEAAIHQLEFSKLEITGDDGPFGLTLFFRSILPMQHGALPEDALTIHTQFKKLRLLSSDKNYFPSLIKKYLLNNPHFLTHTFSPDPHLEKKEQESEQKKLKKIEATLTEEEKQAIQEQTKKLKAYQEETENQSLECLPKIHLADVPKKPQEYHLHHEQNKQLTLFHHECFTNHITYAKLLFDLPQFDENDLPYLQLFTSILPELGAGGRDYLAHLDYINAYLGDFGTSISLYPQIEDPRVIHPSFGFKGKVLTRNIDKLFQLFADVCQGPDLSDKERIKTLILQIHTSLENRLNRIAVSYAIQRSIANQTQSAFVGEKMSGLPYFCFIRNLTATLDENLDQIIATFEKLSYSLFHLTSPHLILSCDDAQYRILSKEHFFGLDELPTRPFTPWKNFDLPSHAPSEGKIISTPIAFSAYGLSTPNITHPVSPALSISTSLMENTFLHKKVREQGGAYGCRAHYNPTTGDFYFYSYRDPHVRLTYEAFLEGIERIADGQFTNRHLEEAKLGILQGLDSPVAPGSRASVAYHQFREGQTKQKRQEFRDHLISTSKEEVIHAVATHLKGKQGRKITFGGENVMKNENPGLTISPL